MTYSNICIFGAGTIGCYLGGHWAAAGVPVTLLGRERVLTPLRNEGLQMTGCKDVHLAPGQIGLETDPAVLARADLIVLTMKTTALDAALAVVQRHARPEVPVLCLQNGLSAADVARAALPGHPVLAGLVPFNVVWRGPAHVHRSRLGAVVAEPHPVLAPLVTATAQTGAPLKCIPNIAQAQWQKLFLNLNNPINALSGVPLIQQLGDRGFRLIYSDAVAEALKVMRAAGKTYGTPSGPRPEVTRRLLRLPSFLFNRLILPQQHFDPDSMTSMAVDMAQGRTTEIDMINGEVMRLGGVHGVQTPVNTGLVRLIHQAEQGGPRVYTSAALRQAIDQVQGE